MDDTEILLVEDNKSDAELTMRALKKFDVAVRLHWVKDGAEALDYIFRDQGENYVAPKMVLLDLKLPKIDGIEVLRRIKADPKKMDEKQTKELEELLNEMLRTLCPDLPLAEMSSMQKIRTVVFYIEETQGKKVLEVALGSQLTGATSFPS